MAQHMEARILAYLERALNKMSSTPLDVDVVEQYVS